jgi:hypothetical protein
MKVNRKVAVSSAALVLGAGVIGAGLTTGTANASRDTASSTGTDVQARLHPLNDSGVRGVAMVDSHGRRLDIDLHARGLAKGLPHAMHIHYGEQARHECPNFRDDTNGDFRLNVAEGVPDYGPIAVSLTTKGDSSPASGLAVDRFPTAPKGRINYERDTKTMRAVARAIRDGEGVVVVHGIDYNRNGQYDFDSAGASELNEAVPAEATDPAACGVLKH